MTFDKKLRIDQLATSRFSDKDIFDILNSESEKIPTKSVSKPSAQSSNQCDVVSDVDALLSIVRGSLLATKSNNIPLHHFINIQFLNGLRVSELLAVRSYDINRLGQIVIKGLKGSNSRICNTGNSADFLLQCKMNNCDPFPYFSRFFVYREFKKLGLSYRFAGNEKSSVTHLMRHLVVKLQQEDIDSLELSQSFLGHKSLKSTTHYEK